MAGSNKKEKDYSENYQKVYNKIQKVIPPNRQAFYHRILNEWTEDYGDVVFIDLLPNKLDEYLLCIYHYKTIYLIGPSYPTILYAPKIMFQMKSHNHLHIDDVLMKTNDIGNGSVAMQGLIQYSKLIGVSHITGYLSSVDDDHKNRRNHFYEKFGFDVGENNIQLTIQKGNYDET